MKDPLQYFLEIEPFEPQQVKAYTVGAKYALIELITGDYGLCGVNNQTLSASIPQQIDLNKPAHRYLYACYLNALFNPSHTHLPATSFVENIPSDRYECIVMIGIFRPLLQRYKALHMNPMVFDMHKDEPGLTPMKEQKKWLQKADLVILTGTALANNTFSGIVENMAKNTQLVITGPSTLMHPHLFSYLPNTILSGMVFTPHQPELTASIQKGYGTQHFKVYGKKVDVYPA